MSIERRGLGEQRARGSNHAKERKYSKKTEVETQNLWLFADRAESEETNHSDRSGPKESAV